MEILSSHQMKTLEFAASNLGISYHEMMMSAGREAAYEIFSFYKPKACVVLCGTGNNGGDGFITAAVLKKLGVHVVVIPLLGEPKADLAKQAMSYALSAGVKITNTSSLKDDCENTEIVIDAVFGTGFNKTLPDCVIQAIQAVKNKTVVSLDLPSGLNADMPSEGPCFQASLTLCFEAAKLCCMLYPSRSLCGLVKILPIGIPNAAWDVVKQTGLVGKTLTLSETIDNLSKRDAASHKGKYGKLLCVCGSTAFGGAAALAALSAFRTGVGSVKVTALPDIMPIVATAVLEATYLKMQPNPNGNISANNLDSILDAAKNSTALLIGCGLGLDSDISRLVCSVVEEAACPLIIDADALNALSHNINILKRCKFVPILTPHIGEMARMTRLSPQEVLSRAPSLAQEFSNRHHCVVVLKSASTIIASPECPLLYYSGGHPGLAKAGSGDVLAGMIASFRAQGLDTETAAAMGVTLHGEMAKKCEARLSARAMFPHDILQDLCMYFTEKNM